MKIQQQLLDPALRWEMRAGGLQERRAQLVLAFGGRKFLEQPATVVAVQRAHPGASVVLVSTSGELLDTAITDDHVAVTAIAFEKSHVGCAATTVRNQFESREAGRVLATRLRGYGLRHVLVFSDGQLVNGTALADGFNEGLPAGVTLTGGLAGDGQLFERTVVGLDEPPLSGRIVAIGLYGHRLAIGFGSSGGWSPDAADHTATASTGNIVFKIDGQPALDLYRDHLGELNGAALPASGLSYPFCVTPAPDAPAVVRSVLGIDETTRSMVFAGDVPCGSHVRFMHASHDDLISGARQAAQQARLDAGTELALCVSCVGRRIVLGPRTPEELASVRDILGPNTPLIGFYSYGELAPAGLDTGCQLHNQTMTITTLREN